MTEQKARLVSDFYRAIADKQQTVEILENIIASGEDIGLHLMIEKSDEQKRTAPYSFTFHVSENDFSHDIVCEILKHERQILSEMKHELSEMEG